MFRHVAFKLWTRLLVFKALLLQFYRLVPHETPTPGSLSEDSLLLPGRHQFELVGDMTSILHRPFRGRMLRTSLCEGDLSADHPGG